MYMCRYCRYGRGRAPNYAQGPKNYARYKNLEVIK